jgi:hypothetical protein
MRDISTLRCWRFVAIGLKIAWAYLDVRKGPNFHRGGGDIGSLPFRIIVLREESPGLAV